jgi:hypothetical protein
MEKPLRSDRMPGDGSDAEQLDKLMQPAEEQARRGTAQSNQAAEAPFWASSRRRGIRVYATEYNPVSLGGNFRHIAIRQRPDFHAAHASLERRIPAGKRGLRSATVASVVLPWRDE